MAMRVWLGIQLRAPSGGRCHRERLSRVVRLGAVACTIVTALIADASYHRGDAWVRIARCCLGAAELATSPAALAAQWAARRSATGDARREDRAMDGLAVAPEHARPSALLPPDRVLEHVLWSLASLPAEDAAEQAFRFSWLGDQESPVGSGPVQRKEGWEVGTVGLLDRAAFRTMLDKHYLGLLDRHFEPLRHLRPPHWDEDDRRVAFTVALGRSAGSKSHAKSHVSVTLRRPGQGTHRDCWLVSSVALHAYGPSAGDSEPGQVEHNAYQEQTFNAKADIFGAPGATAPAVAPKMERIARACQLDAQTSILDVATGTGALLPFFEAAGATLADVVGVDISAGMLRYAESTYPSASFYKDDILTFQHPQGRRFDRVVFNACFGNLWDQMGVVAHVSESLVKGDGLIIISHPLGRKYLKSLQKSDPRMVLHELPTESEWHQLLTQHAPDLSLESIDDDVDYYCAVLRRKPLS